MDVGSLTNSPEWRGCLSWGGARRTSEPRHAVADVFGGGVHGPKPYEFIGFGDIHGPKPYEFIGLGDIHGPKPYEFIASRGMDSIGDESERVAHGAGHRSSQLYWGRFLFLF